MFWLEQQTAASVPSCTIYKRKRCRFPVNRQISCNRLGLDVAYISPVILAWLAQSLARWHFMPRSHGWAPSCWCTLVRLVLRVQQFSFTSKTFNLQIKCHRIVPAPVLTRSLKAFHPWRKTLYSAFIYTPALFKCPHRAVCTCSTSPLWRTSPGGAWLLWWACTVPLRALSLLPGECHP